MARQWAMELCRHGLTSQIMQLLCALSETTSLTISFVFGKIHSTTNLL